MAYFEGEEAGLKVKEILKEASGKEKELFISVINWGEVLYVIEGRYGIERRDEIERLMGQMHLEIVPADSDQARTAAHLKAAHRLPYADCFAAALAIKKKASLVTGDKDFKPIEAELKIDWL